MSIQSLIETRGYVFQEQFLDEREIASLRADFNSASADNKNYPIRELDLKNLPPSVAEKLSMLARLCFPAHDLMLIGGAYFRIDRSNLQQSVNFPWHQDHESYYQHRQHYHYLNFWIPLEKETVEDSNLSVVPFDRLKQADPLLHDVIVGSGATRYYERHIIQDVTGCTMRFNCNLDELTYTPHMRPGDLMLVRGDIIHRTQNLRASRMSISFRMIDRHHIINRSYYYPSSLEHLKFIQKNIKPYLAFSYCLHASNVDFMALGDLIEQIEQRRANFSDEARREVQEYARRYDLAIRRRAQMALQLQQLESPETAAA